MTTRLILSALAVGTCLAIPGTALAKRAPTATEAAAIRSAVTAYIKNPSSHASPDNKIAKMFVSTVDARYAAANLTSVSGNSTTLLKGAKASWKVIGFSPSQACSLAPTAVRTDLGVKCGMK